MLCLIINQPFLSHLLLLYMQGTDASHLFEVLVDVTDQCMACGGTFDHVSGQPSNGSSPIGMSTIHLASGETSLPAALVTCIGGVMKPCDRTGCQGCQVQGRMTTTTKLVDAPNPFLLVKPCRSDDKGNDIDTVPAFSLAPMAINIPGRAPIIYSIRAIIHYHAAHYKTFVCLGNTWVCFDDMHPMRVMEVDEAAVLEAKPALILLEQVDGGEAFGVYIHQASSWIVLFPLPVPISCFCPSPCPPLRWAH